MWDEETTDAIKAFGDSDPTLYPEVHRFQVPAGCHWRDIRGAAANVGAALLRAMHEIERANPDTLFRVFGTADWGNREKFTDELLKDLIEGFSSISLGNEVVSTDVLGDAYEYLIGKFADVTRRNKAGEFYTPRSVVRMMVEMLDPREGSCARLVGSIALAERTRAHGRFCGAGRAAARLGRLAGIFVNSFHGHRVAEVTVVRVGALGDRNGSVAACKSIAICPC